MFAGELGEFWFPGEGGADAGDFVGCHLFAVAGASGDDGDAAGVGDDSLGCFDAEFWVVVEWFVGGWAVVCDVVACVGEVRDDLLHLVEGCVVVSCVNSHGPMVP